MEAPKIENCEDSETVSSPANIDDVKIAVMNDMRKMNKLICVIDHDVSCFQVISQTLGRQNFDVIFLQSVEEFLSMKPVPEPDVLLIGVDVFDPDAVDNVSQVVHGCDYRKKPFIFSMSYFMPGSFDHMLQQAGCNLCLRKSNGLEDVISAVQSVEFADNVEVLA